MSSPRHDIKQFRTFLKVTHTKGLEVACPLWIYSPNRLMSAQRRRNNEANAEWIEIRIRWWWRAAQGELAWHWRSREEDGRLRSRVWDIKISVKLCLFLVPFWNSMVLRLVWRSWTLTQMLVSCIKRGVIQRSSSCIMAWHKDYEMVNSTQRRTN